MVSSRQIARKLVYWLAIIGYDPHDSSLTHRIYLVYIGIFMSGWFFAVFSLFAGTIADLLRLMATFPVNQVVAILFTLVLLLWGMIQLWQATRISPIVFSENDAYLICQTPVPGSAVALTWFLGGWFEPAVPFWAGAVTLGFGLVEFNLNHNISSADIPAYIAAGLQALLVIALVQFGLMAFIWATGALRLQRDRNLTWQPGVVRLGIIVIGLSLIYSLIHQGLDGFSHPFWHVLLWPLDFMTSSAFGVAPLSIGLVGGLVWVGLGFAALTWAGDGLNLNRTAQETTQKEKTDTAQRYNQSELAQQIILTSRLGTEHSPSPLPVRPGWWMLAWKDLLQSIRAFRLSNMWGWMSLFAVSLGVYLSSDPGARGLLLVIWSMMIGQRVTARLQKDLANWSLIRQLPISTDRLILADLGLPWVCVVLLGWIALVLASGGWSLNARLGAALLLLGVSASISLSAGYDLLRQAKSDMLLSGYAPQISSVGALLGIICLALPLGLWFLFNHLLMIGSLLAFLLAVFLTLIFWQLATNRLQNME